MIPAARFGPRAAIRRPRVGTEGPGWRDTRLIWKARRRIGGGMGVAISSREELEAWLKDKPREWAHVVALRAALRVLPLPCDPAAFRGQPADLRLPLAVFRAGEMLSGARKIPPAEIAAARSAAADGAAVNAAARAGAAAASYGSAAATAAAYASAYAAATVAYHAYASAASDAADHAARAAAALSAASTYAADSPAAYAATGNANRSAAHAAVWAALSGDCAQLEDGIAPAALLDQLLWIERPDWFQDAWGRAAKWLSRPEHGFAIWREWYFGRLEGLPHAFDRFDAAADEDFYRWIIGQNDDWWKREPAAVNADIAAKVEELRIPDNTDDPASESLSAEAASSPPPDTIRPKQVREILQEIASPQAVIANGQISFRANAEFETPDGDLETWHPRHLLDIVDVLRLGLRDNAPNPLMVGLGKYHEVLSRDPELPIITTLQACIGVVRDTRSSDGHEIWAEGLEKPFDALFEGHERLLKDYPRLQERRRLRDKITPTPAARKADGLDDDITRFADVATRLKQLGVTDDTAHSYLQALVDIARQIAIGLGSNAAEPDDTGDWPPPAQIRADMTGVMARIESQISLLLSITGHPNVQAALVAIAPELARLLTFFG